MSFVFRMSLDIGNDAVVSSLDLSQLIQKVSRKVREYNLDDVTQLPVDRHIMDINGNTIGSWSIQEES